MVSLTGFLCLVLGAFVYNLPGFRRFINLFIYFNCFLTFLLLSFDIISSFFYMFCYCILELTFLHDSNPIRDPFLEDTRIKSEPYKQRADILLSGI